MWRRWCVGLLAVFLFVYEGSAEQAVGSISGRVVEAQSGQPLAKMLMWADSMSVVDGQMHGSAQGWVLTGEDGRYEIKGLPPGEYLLRVETGPRVGVRSGEEHQSAAPHYRSAYFQNAGDWRLATTLTLRAGERLAGADFRLISQATFYVRGTVESVDAVRMFLTEEPDRQNGIPGGNQGQLEPGPFEIGPVWAGQYWLYAYSGKRFEPGFRSSFVRVRVPGKESEQLMVSLAPAFPVEVQLRVDGDHPAPWTEAKWPLTILLDPLLSNQSSPLMRATVSTAGSARVDGVSAEPYEVSVELLPKGWVVKSIEQNGRALSEPIVEFSPAASAQRLEITVAPVSSAVAIQVVEKGRAVGGAMVTMVPEWYLRRWWKVSPWHGTAAVAGVLERGLFAPGEYRVIELPPGSLWGREGGGDGCVRADGDAGGEAVRRARAPARFVFLGSADRSLTVAAQKRAAGYWSLPRPSTRQVSMTSPSRMP